MSEAEVRDVAGQTIPASELSEEKGSSGLRLWDWQVGRRQATQAGRAWIDSGQERTDGSGKEARGLVALSSLLRSEPPIARPCPWAG